MQPFDQCPICGGELVRKQVEKLLRGGTNTAVLHVIADVCLRCGERLYAVETVEQFERIRRKLEQQDTVGFDPVGTAFRVP
jgi:YgiT-type zinc finger domain-containing protein